MARLAPPFSTLRRAVATLAIAAALPAFAALKWESLEAAVKVRANDSVAHASYSFVNTGDRPITISDVHAGCGCTVPHLDKSTYAPGERGELRVDFHPGNREGLYRATVTVASDDATTTTLQFVADIEAIVSFDTRFVYWKGAEARTPKRMRLTIAEGQTASLAEVKSSNPKFAVAFSPVGDTGREFDIVVTPPAEALDYTAISIRAQFGPEKAERDLTVVARTL